MASAGYDHSVYNIFSPDTAMLANPLTISQLLSQASAELAGSAQAPATFPGMGFSVGPGSFTPAFVQNLTTSSLMPEGVASPAITYTIADACEGEVAVSSRLSSALLFISCTL